MTWLGTFSILPYRCHRPKGVPYSLQDTSGSPVSGVSVLIPPLYTFPSPLHSSNRIIIILELLLSSVFKRFLKKPRNLCNQRAKGDFSELSLGGLKNTPD